VLSDNELNRRVMQEQMASWEIRHGGFAGAEQALEAMRGAVQAGDPYHFVLLDCPLRDGGGVAFAQAIRANPSLRSCVIVMASSIGQDQEAGQTPNRLVDACLSKPLRQSQLFNTLTNAWAGRQGMEVGGRLPAKGNAPDIKRAVSGKFAAYNGRILVVEDNVVNQKVACRLLESLGLRTDVAANGREAVEMSALVPYGLILMDCQMPEMDGYEATRTIRRREGPARRIAVIAMTADAMAGSRERCLEAGMDDYISKPVKLEELHRALSAWLPRTQPAPA
jgi:CheY-like chemotaxis protein